MEPYVLIPTKDVRRMVREALDSIVILHALPPDTAPTDAEWATLMSQSIHVAEFLRCFLPHQERSCPGPRPISAVIAPIVRRVARAEERV